ncbi:hypothetical protein EJB05_05630 [Eragrostis curvula]|uniref:Zinc finger PHD-type domain-containing protein n=1 Tax=Eragrostis curvula TaxID=38414 RepID=A0A5J9WBI4_9POAL|nr:hypothetical protein EJB05_05630 [Eragrostis curvula]
MKPAALCELNTVCEVCGDIGFKHLLLHCRDCLCSTAHQYCLDKVVFDASLADWVCYECLQRLGEVTCSRSLEKVSSERPPSHARFCSKSQQPIIKSVESARDAEPRRNNMESGANLTGVGNTPTIEERSSDFVDTAHGAAESSESSTRFAESQKGSYCHRRQTVQMATTSTSFEESGEDIPSESESLESDDLQAPPGDSFVLSRTSYLSGAQKKRVKAFIQETKPEVTVF